MSVFADLVSKIRTKRKQKFESVAQEYDAAVFAIATGEEVDADHIATLLDALDLSDSVLGDDLKDKERRIEIIENIKRLEKVEIELGKKEAELARLQDEIEQFLTPRKAKVAALFESIRFMQADVGNKPTWIHDLQFGETVPRHLRQRRDELTARRKEWGSKLREYEDATAQPRTMVRQYANRIEALDERLRRAAAADHEPLAKSRQEAEQERQRYQAIIDSLAADKASLDSELREIEAAERQLNAELLKP